MKSNDSPGWSSRRRFRPAVEDVERRKLLTTFVVTSPLDNPDSPVDNSLRKEILDSNSQPSSSGPNLILFDLPSGMTIIKPTAALPAITTPVIIDGRVSQAGGPAVTLDGTNATPDGASASDGLDVQAGDSAIEGLAIINFAGSGISLGGPGGDLVNDDYIGVGTDGSTVAGNGVDGVTITGPNNTIGGANIASGDVVTTFLSNIITNNGLTDQSGDGIRITGAGASGNLVLGNDLGVDSSGNNGRGNGNSNDGVLIDGASSNTIGGTSAATRNVISSNGIGSNNPNNEDGVEINGPGASDNLIEGNYIGLDFKGSDNPDGNANNGVQIVGGPNNSVRDNVISGNNGGIEIDDQTATGNVVAGNLIGLDSSGTLTNPNFGNGVEVDGALDNTIGGTTPGDRNVISANEISGILLDVGGSTNSSASGNSVLGNYIGTDAKGDSHIGFGNGQDGVLINGVPDNFIGGPGHGNVIDDNASAGVRILHAGATGNVVLGNLIGVDASGENRLGNFTDGVRVVDASGNTVGGTADGDRNVISGNDGDGVSFENSGAAGAVVMDNAVLGNYIGLDAKGSANMGNTLNGVRIRGGSFNTVGGTTTAARNVIARNNLDGVDIQSNGGTDSDNNVVSGDFIGTDASGTHGLGNLSAGVEIFEGSHNLIGGTAEGARNVIAFNGAQGISITGAPITDPKNPSVVIGNRSVGNQILGDYIGTDATGGDSDPNGSDGVYLDDAIANTIGGTDPGDRVVIYDNSGDGINLSFGSDNNAVRGNYVGIGAHGETGVGNHGSGVFVYNSSGNTIGGTAAGAGNVISNNQVSGLDITRLSAGNLAQGNYVGLDPSGEVAEPNGLDGISIGDGSSANTIGGLAGAASRNVISGNTGNGVSLIPASGPAATGNAVVGNYIGTDAGGTSTGGANGKPLGNLGNGILINASSQNTAAVNLISGNSLLGVNISGAAATANLVFANLIGTDASGTKGADALGRSMGNGGGGLLIGGSQGNTIGGPTIGLGNVISNNAGIGVQISGAGASGNVVQGNVIGTDILGRTALGNTQIGLEIFDAGDNVIGGLEPGARNIISGNRSAGIQVLGSNNGASGNLIVGNRIGSDFTATTVVDPSGKPLGNSGDGILIQQATGEFVFLNSILGNTGSGVDIEGGGQDILASNLVGTDAAGDSHLGNHGDGIFIDASAGNTVGGITPFDRNVISGNGGDGLALTGTSAAGNIVFGDSIGIDPTAKFAVANQLDGVRLSDAGAGNDVSGDIVSGNAGAGIEITGSSTGSPTVQGNLVGTDATGLDSLPNPVGIFIHDNPQPISIGGTTPAARNVISGNGIGVVILQVSPQSSGVTLEGNFIGTDSRGGGAPAASTQSTGVFIDNATKNVIGGTASGSGNLISGNTTAGIQVFGQAGIGDVKNLIQGNIIGAFLGVPLSRQAPPSSTSGQASAAQAVGVLINTSAGNTVGGAAPGAGNVIAGNLTGVEVVGTTTTTSVVPNNVIQGNVVDYDAIGVFLNNSVNDLVGGPNPGQGNEIDHNTLQGITLFGSQASGNAVQGNHIDSNSVAGVYADGSVNNTIGGAVGNEISGNGATNASNGVGVYLFNGATGNLVQRNQIRSNTGYGVFLYNSAGNVAGIVRVGPARNTLTNNRIAEFREFTGPVPPTSTSPASVSTPTVAAARLPGN